MSSGPVWILVADRSGSLMPGGLEEGSDSGEVRGGRSAFRVFEIHIDHKPGPGAGPSPGTGPGPEPHV